jgi:Holliday junction resolvase
MRFFLRGRSLVGTRRYGGFSVIRTASLDSGSTNVDLMAVNVLQCKLTEV